MNKFITKLIASTLLLLLFFLEVQEALHLVSDHYAVSETSLKELKARKELTLVPSNLLHTIFAKLSLLTVELKEVITAKYVNYFHSETCLTDSSSRGPPILI